MTRHALSDDHDERYMLKDEILELLHLPDDPEIIIYVKQPSPIFPYQEEYHVTLRPRLEAGVYVNIYSIPRRHRVFEIDLANNDFSSPLYIKAE